MYDVASLPSSVRQYVEDVQRATGITPDVRRKSNRWRVTVQSPRVVVVSVLRAGSPADWSKSTLIVDDQRRKPPNDLNELALFFHDTDVALKQRWVEVVPLEPTDMAAAPAFVRHIYSGLVTKASKLEGDVDVRVATTDYGGWRIGIYFEDSCIELSYARYNGRWRAARHQPIRLIVDNEDVSHEVRSFGEALRRLLSGRGDQLQGDQPTGHARDVQGVANSVRVRRATVIRN